jgi:hypothetical protein
MLLFIHFGKNLIILSATGIRTIVDGTIAEVAALQQLALQ